MMIDATIRVLNTSLSTFSSFLASSSPFSRRLPLSTGEFRRVDARVSIKRRFGCKKKPTPKKKRKKEEKKEKLAESRSPPPGSAHLFASSGIQLIAPNGVPRLCPF